MAEQIRKHVYNEAKDYFYITLGLLILTIGWTFFLLPYEIVTGGVTGISAIIFYATNGAGHGIPIMYSYFVINAVLLILALKILGWRFLMKTIYAISMLSLMLGVAQDIITNDDGSMIRLLGDQDFMSLIIGCCFTGTALAVVFLHNGSTGGTDIVAAVVNKYKDLPSIFFTLDFAELNDGSWKILEAGDGSVSGPSEGQNLEAFYRAIYQCLN